MKVIQRENTYYITHESTDLRKSNRIFGEESDLTELCEALERIGFIWNREDSNWILGYLVNQDNGMEYLITLNEAEFYYWGKEIKLQPIATVEEKEAS